MGCNKLETYIKRNTWIFVTLQKRINYSLNHIKVTNKNRTFVMKLRIDIVTLTNVQYMRVHLQEN